MELPPMSKRTHDLVNHPEDAIGKQVFKPSGKPFKSGKKVNTANSLTINPNTGRKAFTFIEDDSIVDVCQCELVSHSNLASICLKLEEHIRSFIPKGWTCPIRDVDFIPHIHADQYFNILSLLNFDELSKFDHRWYIRDAVADFFSTNEQAKNLEWIGAPLSIED
jgi:hypothetical protein